MKYYDEQLRQLREDMSRMKQLDAMAAELRSQRDSLSSRVLELKAAMRNEQADVDRLEGRSLAAFFYNVIGKMDEQLSKEREEAYAARVKYDSAALELQQCEDELRACLDELATLRGCERRYEAVLREKSTAVKAAGGKAAEEIMALEEQCALLQRRGKELREAISAGSAAFGTAHQVLSSLDSAEGWGTFDLLGGGLISDLAKHSHLDEAQYAVEQLQSELRRFKTELADVHISADMTVNIDGFMRFADYFFDGLFADWAVLDRISQSRYQVQLTVEQISQVLHRLESMLKDSEADYARARERLDALVRETV